MSVIKNLSVTSGVFVFFAVCVLSLVSAQNDFEFSTQGDMEPLDEIQELLQKVQSLYEQKIAPKVQDGVVADEEGAEKDLEMDGEIEVPQETSGCSCAKLACTCCKRICVPKLGINQNYCLSTNYIPAWKVIQVTLKADYHVIFSTKVSVAHPKSICVPIACRMPGVSVCLKFYNVRVNNGWALGCSKVVVNCPRGVVAIVDLGCFRMHCIDEKRVDGQQQTPLNDAESIDVGEDSMEILTRVRHDGKL